MDESILNTDLETTAHPVILFDGVCNLCNGAVNFIIDRDLEAQLRFAPLQSDPGRALTARYGVDPETTDSLVLVESGHCYVRSAAALRIARRLSGGWPLFYALILLPRPLRDALYDWIARNRYRWFGTRETCRLPTPEDRARFLAYDPPTVAG